MTLFEMLIVIAVLMIVIALLLPSRARAKKGGGPEGRCRNNLKHIWVGFEVWQQDNNDKFPAQVPANRGGAMEFVGGPQMFRLFQVMSNELNTPKILICPNDYQPGLRNMATTFAHGGGSSTSNGFISNSNVSYFVGVDAERTSPRMLLSGDGHLTDGTAIAGGLLTVATNHPIRWTQKMHGNRGNILLADGSVQGMNSVELQLAVENSGVATNRLALP